MRGAFRAAALALLFFAPGVCAQAQQIVLSDGSRYASIVDYYAGTWKWERPQPRQAAIVRFGRDGSFFFHNLSNGIQHYGRYKAGTATITVALERSCSDNGGSCQVHEPPEVKNYPFKPAGANVFEAGAERWERQKSDQRPSM